MNSAYFFACPACGACVIDVEFSDLQRRRHEAWHAANIDSVDIDAIRTARAQEAVICACGRSHDASPLTLMHPMPWLDDGIEIGRQIMPDQGDSGTDPWAEVVVQTAYRMQAEWKPEYERVVRTALAALGDAGFTLRPLADYV